MSPFLGTYIASLRESRRLTQRQLAERLGVGAGYLSQIERGRRHYLGREMVARLEMALRLTEGELTRLNLLRDLSKGVLSLPPDTPADAAALAGLMARIATPLSADQISALRSLIEALDVAHGQLGGSRAQHV